MSANRARELTLNADHHAKPSLKRPCTNRGNNLIERHLTHWQLSLHPMFTTTALQFNLFVKLTTDRMQLLFPQSSMGSSKVAP